MFGSGTNCDAVNLIRESVKRKDPSIEQCALFCWALNVRVCLNISLDNFTQPQPRASLNIFLADLFWQRKRVCLIKLILNPVMTAKSSNLILHPLY